MTVTHKKLMCLNKIDRGTHTIVCGRKMDDIGVDEISVDRYCPECEIVWRVNQTEDGNITMQKLDKSKRVYPKDQRFSIMEVIPNGKSK